MAALASKMGRLKGFSATQEVAAHKLAERFSKILGSYIDPYSLEIWPARGYWTHMYQDVQRFTGVFPRPDLEKLTYDFGSWELTVSDIAKGCRFEVHDQRGVYRADANFTIEVPPRKTQCASPAAPVPVDE